MTVVTTEAELEAIYGRPGEPARLKVKDRLIPEYRRLVEASPFVALATAGPEGLDCSPRGDAGNVLFVEDERTLLMPDRPGNNRIDSLRNIVRDPRVALMFLIPGSDTTLRMNGKARISVEPALLERFAVDGRQPRSVVVITIAEVYFQCARAVMRAGLWQADRQVDPASLPTPGAMLKAAMNTNFDDRAYDRDWPARAAKGLW